MGLLRKANSKKKATPNLDTESALCIIDWQRFFVHPESPGFIPETIYLKSKLAILVDIFISAGLPVVATRHSNRTDRPNNFLRFYGRVIERQSEWFELADPLDNFKELFVFDKETYSVFENPGFNNFLSDNGIRTVILAGVQTDRCVLATAISGFDRGYEMVVVPELCASRNKFRHRAALNLMKNSFAVLVDFEEISGSIKGANCHGI